MSDTPAVASSPELPPSPAAITEPPTSHPERMTFAYVKRPGLLKITVVSFLLGIVTLGFYRFWAKTRVRQHIWSSVIINGEPLEYTGTGWELCKGFLVVLALFVLPFAIGTTVATLVQGPESPVAILLQTMFFLAFYVLWGFAVYRARKYQLSRTLWRGIRGTLVGSAMIYSLLYFGSMMAKGMSLGWATPVMNTVLQEQITNDMRFGDAAFKFKGRAGPLYPTYALCWLLTLGAIIFAIVGFASSTALSGYLKDIFDPLADAETSENMVNLFIGGFAIIFLVFMLLIPLLWSVYTAKELRTFADYTRFDGVPFRMDATAGSVIGLTVVNILLFIFTLGIAWPFIMQRTVKFVIDRLSMDGLVDIDRIRQSTVRMDTRGEGLADAFDVGGL